MYATAKYVLLTSSDGRDRTALLSDGSVWDTPSVGMHEKKNDACQHDVGRGTLGEAVGRAAQQTSTRSTLSANYTNKQDFVSNKPKTVRR